RGERPAQRSPCHRPMTTPRLQVHSCVHVQAGSSSAELSQKVRKPERSVCGERRTSPSPPLDGGTPRNIRLQASSAHEAIWLPPVRDVVPVHATRPDGGQGERAEGR